jgi:hypothetical protein
MNEHELDRAIDLAARALVSREPGRALTYNVMSRVRKGAEPESRRLVWASAAASALVCVAIAIVFLYRTPRETPPVSTARPLVVGAPATTLDPSILMTNDLGIAPPHSAKSPVVQRAMSTAALSPVEVSPIEPIEPEPISVAAIDVLQIEREAPASLDALKIEALTIEPLAASND